MRMVDGGAAAWRDVRSETPETWQPEQPAPMHKGSYYFRHRNYLRSQTELMADFERLASKWEYETLLVSSPQRAAMNPAYQQIIGLGLQAVPLLLDRLQDTHRNYFWALASITQEDPAKLTESVSDAVTAWVAWGLENGYLDG